MPCSGHGDLLRRSGCSRGGVLRSELRETHAPQRTYRLGTMHADCQRHGLGHVFREVIQPESFNPIRFSQYARELSKAVERMGATSDLKAELGDDSAKVRFGPSTKYVTLGGRTIELDQSAGTDDIRRAFNLKAYPMSDQLPTVDIVKPAEPIKKNLTGASFLANLIRTQHAAIKKQLDDAGSELVTAMTDLQETANEATNQVKAVKAETADLKAALGLNSNGDPAT